MLVVFIKLEKNGLILLSTKSVSFEDSADNSNVHQAVLYNMAGIHQHFSFSQLEMGFAAILHQSMFNHKYTAGAAMVENNHLPIY